MASKILIIEDDEALVELVTLRLEGAGYDVCSAPDAMLGIKTAHLQAPDLILLDLKVPAGGGVAVLNSLSKSINTKKIPVIIMTGTADTEKKRQMHEFGIKTYIQKPFTPEELLQAIASALPGTPTSN